MGVGGLRSLRHLFPILGARAGLAFGSVAFLIAALLATVHLTSRYALKLYVEDQLRRVRWDLAVYQKGPAGGSLERVPRLVQSVDGIERVETVAFLRAQFPERGEVVSLVDGRRIRSPWVSLLAASDLSILPSQLRFALSRPSAQSNEVEGASSTAVLALVGPERDIGDSFLDLQGARQFVVGVHVGGFQHVLFETSIKQVIRLERDELNRWFMDQTGSITFVPHIGLIVLMPFRPDILARFDSVAAGLVPADMQTLGDPNSGHVQEAEYEPEVAYLARVDRDRLISGWDIGGSLERVSGLALRVRDAARQADQSAEHDLEPSTMVRAALPSSMVGAAFPSSVVGAAFPSSVVGTAFPSSVVGAGFPSSVVGAAFPSSVVGAAFPSSVVGAAFPSSVVGAAFRRPTHHPRVLLVDDPRTDAERRAVSNRFIVDSTTEVLLMRMERLSRVVGLVTVLVALPLLCVAWLLAASLAGLLMLNERRLLGLMRLRGVPGEAMGRALLVAIIAGGTIGGAAGLMAGSVGTLAVYERGRVPLSVLLTPSQVIAGIQLIVVSVAMAFFVSRRLVRYATTISPLEAARRVETSEAERTGLRFGWLQAAALAVGAYVLVSWVVPSAGVFTSIPVIGRVLDFVGMPLFVYGIAVLLTSRRRQMQAAVAPMARLAAGTLGPLAEKHIAVKPHRTLAFLLIVALMVSVSLYPVITSASFEEKAARGARVQIGADWQLLFNSPDLTDVSRLQGSLGEQRDALREPIERLASRVAAVPGVTSVTYLIEALLPNIYLPDYGLRGVPAYLVGDTSKYLETVYTEPELGITDRFDRLTERLAEGEVVVSPAVAQFKKLTPGSRLRLGIDGSRRGVVATTAGVVAQFPGIPARSVTDRQGYVEARIDYLNHLFSNNAYVVAAADNPSLAPMRVVIPRVILLVSASPGAAPDAFRQRLIAALPFPPLEIHSLDEEVSKVASDMYISLVLANIQIYLFGGLVLALVAIVSVSAANYVEDRRTLALLRIRGASPPQLWRFMLALLLSPAVVGLAIGAAVALVAGYGLANHVWDLREIKTVVQLLDTHLVLSPALGSLAALVVAMLVAAVSAFSWWVFRRTAHRTLQET